MQIPAAWKGLIFMFYESTFCRCSDQSSKKFQISRNNMVSVTALDGFSSMLCGEGPHWVEKDQSLLLVDIPAGYIYRYFSETGRIQKLKLGKCSHLRYLFLDIKKN